MSGRPPAAIKISFVLKSNPSRSFIKVETDWRKARMPSAGG